MTVAPSRSKTLPQYSQVLQALKPSLRLAHQTHSEHIASLAFPLPSVDPLAVLLSCATPSQRQCYFESPSRGQAIAAWDALVQASFSGGDRFSAARQALETWQRRITTVPELREGPYFFTSFSFFDTLPSTVEGFAPATLLLTRWQVVRQRHRCMLIANVGIRPRMRLAPLAHQIVEQVRRLQALSSTARLPESVQKAPLSPQLGDWESDQLQQQVRQTLAAIRTQQVQKRVVAQAFDIIRREPFTRAVALPRLRSRYPDCYIFSFSGGGGSHFIGASPERLLSIRQGRLVTDALAGSAPRGKTLAEDFAIGQRLLSTPKEQQEHRLVLDFIIQQLEAEGLTPCHSTPPGLLRLSNIQHLHTPICAEVPAQISPLSLVESLHPTPAVAGVPTRVACELIRQQEGCDRALYAAPLGWIDPQGNSEFIVGIRSALIQGNRARLYAGAGIMAESTPEQELAEIQLKLQALAQALG